MEQLYSEIDRKTSVPIKKLVELLERTFAQCLSASKTNEYDDETETIKPGKEVKKQRNLRKSIEGARQELERITDPVERIRRMYGILLKMLEAYGIALEKYDTTSDIYSKSCRVDRGTGLLSQSDNNPVPLSTPLSTLLNRDREPSPVTLQR